MTFDRRPCLSSNLKCNIKIVVVVGPVGSVDNEFRSQDHPRCWGYGMDGAIPCMVLA
jgi:hypothetical protein